MARQLLWAGQAREVIERGLPVDYADPNRPDLAQIKSAMLVIGMALLRSARRGGPVPVVNATKTVRVWFLLRKHEVLGVAVQCSYDGGRTFVNPLLRYGRVGDSDPGA